MSDPVTKAQIEDVLSSIRRLVSEDSRQPMRRSGLDAAPERPPSPDHASAEKLVLTPSLRVADPVATDRDEDRDAQEAEAAFSEVFDEDVADFIEITPDLEEDRPSGEVIEIAPEIEDDSAFEAELEFEDDGGELDDGSPDQDVEEDIVADIEDAAPEEATELDAEGEDIGEGAAPWTDPDATLFEAAGVTVPSEHADDQGGETADETLTRKVAQLERMISGQDEAWEPDGVQAGDDYSGTEVESMTWEDASPETESTAQTTRTPLRAVPSIHDDPDTDSDEGEPVSAAMQGLEDAVLDEAALRELVADIVREELQGVLGERITRNVRKLVRREIHRALSIQDLD